MRTSGVLMHLTSLPSPYGVGTMGQAARDFADFLAAAGQTWWQILPIGPTSFGDSPYQSFSTFAGNPYLIDLDDLAADGLLKREEYASLSWGDDPRQVDFGLLYRQRNGVLRRAVQRLLEAPPADYGDFLAGNGSWLPDYALFMALKEENGGRSWQEWPDSLRRREPAAMDAARARLADPMDFWQGVQYLFFRQWSALKDYANRLGVRFIGDLPIYVSGDSADVGPARTVPAGRGHAARGGGRRPAGRLHRRRPAVGQPPLRLGADGGRRLRLVDPAHPLAEELL